jgi:hypothetical protein
VTIEDGYRIVHTSPTLRMMQSSKKLPSAANVGLDENEFPVPDRQGSLAYGEYAGKYVKRILQRRRNPCRC